MKRLALGLTIWFAAELCGMGAYSNEWVRMKGITPQGYLCQRAATPLTIDGRMDEVAWRTAPWTVDFADIEGAGKPAPRFRTRAKMLWDDTYFYVAAELEEPHVWGTLTNHDAVIFQDPDFEIFIDPNGDNHEYYEIELNALNTEWDLRLRKPYKDGGPALNEWEIPGLRSGVWVKGTLNDPHDVDEGWTVEIAFPWAALGSFAGCSCPPATGDQWRVNFSRVEWQIRVVEGKYVKTPKTPEDNWVWSPTGIVDMHRPERWGLVQFTRETSVGKGFKSDPSMPARDWLMEVYYAQRSFFAQNKHWAGSLDELGLTAKEGNPSTTIRLTPEGYEASAKAAGGTTWRIRQDSLLSE
jgi:hypothetical protein